MSESFNPFQISQAVRLRFMLEVLLKISLSAATDHKIQDSILF